MDRGNFPPDFDDETIAMIRRVQPYTMTSPERLFALRQSVQYLVRHNVPGAMVECGVWRGGSMMAVALTLLEMNAADRVLYLYDTYEGMSSPTDRDRTFEGVSAAAILGQSDKSTHPVWAYSPIETVQRALLSTGYTQSLIQYVVGPVEQTLPAIVPDAIALLRLDTDWYESTYHELTHLYPRLCNGGVLIVDDYGHWEGCRLAVDQYLMENRLPLLLHRIDYTGRIGVKFALQ